MNNEQIGVTGYGLRPDIFIPITNENSIYSKEFLFRDGGGLWFYAHLAKDGEIILEMGDDKLYKLGYDYYGNKINK